MPQLEKYNFDKWTVMGGRGSDLSASPGSVPDWKGKTCAECKYFTGEECDGYRNEGSERYDDSDACDEFKPKAKND
jgi:hypothetical protein